MKNRTDRIKELTDTFAALLEKQQRDCRQLVSSLVESARTLEGDTADVRFRHHLSQLKRLGDRLELFTEVTRGDFLEKINREIQELKCASSDSRLSSVLGALIETQKGSLNLMCESLLDRLIEVTAAERGFFLFYIPETTEADVVAARNYQTKNLSQEEYSFSRTILGEVLKQGESLILGDASQDPAFSSELSVKRLQLKSVLGVPLRQDERTVGALYLENNKTPSAFDEEDLRLVELVAQFSVFYLRHARLLPAGFEPDHRVYLDASAPSQEMIGRDSKILSALELVNRIADLPATVLIEGESGTGKELIACALHYKSARRDRPLVAVNCAAIPEDLLESELFGHEKGAFTGASDKYVGQIEQSNTGTLFLDEVSELAYPMQAKLLRFLQSHEFRRLGGRENIKVDVRVVAATSKDLKAMMEAKTFQEALYFRLNVIPIRVPSLRDRKDDIQMLVDHFAGKFSAAYSKSVKVEREVYEWLKQYPFPGNVRELENIVHRLIALSRNGSIRVGDLPEEVLQTQGERVSLAKEPLYRILHTPLTDLDDLRRRREEIKRVLAEQELRLAERAVEQAGGNITEAASRLGISRVTLHDVLKRGKKQDQ